MKSSSLAFTKILTCCNKEQENNDKGVAKVEKVGESPSDGGAFDEIVDS